MSTDSPVPAEDRVAEAHRATSGMFARLRSIFKRYPKRCSVIEVSAVFGLLVAYLWIVPFWFWAIYRLDLPVPKILSDIFFQIWIYKDVARGLILSLLLIIVFFCNIVRGITWADVGVRLDNLWQSGRECLFFGALIVAALTIVAYSLPQLFSFE